MTDLLKQIKGLLASSDRDLETIERTLTDGYAFALSLDAERWRLEKRITAMTKEIERGDAAENARELAEIAKRLDRNDEDRRALRGLLSQLRGHADGVRVGSPAA